jgi:hypothetical protein
MRQEKPAEATTPSAPVKAQEEVGQQQGGALPVAAVADNDPSPLPTQRLLPGASDSRNGKEVKADAAQPGRKKAASTRRPRVGSNGRHTT